MKIDRSEAARALAKAIAYAECGKRDLADEWARELIVLLAAHRILNVEALQSARAANPHLKLA